jgi:predicted phosphodiesterase
MTAIPVLATDAPVIVFGGAYSNLEATQALLAAAARDQVPSGNIICTGDVVAYGADAAATAALVRASGIHVVMGNCEESLGAGAADCGCGFTPGSSCDELSAAWFAHARRELDDDGRAWMAGLPRRLDLVIGGLRLAVVHGAVSSVNRFVFGSTAAAIKVAELDLAGTDGIVAGHCGLPFTQSIGGRLWHNPGAIGLPANDGSPRVWYSVLTPRADGLAIAHCALVYDHATAAAKMRRAGLPDGYAATLATGLWPSCDVLPFREIRARGVRLEPGRTHFVRETPARRRPVAARLLWPQGEHDSAAPLTAEKFRDPVVTAKGEPRASVALTRLRTLWLNTGTLCNITCSNCYIESSPRNDGLVYLRQAEAAAYLDEIVRENFGTEEIGFTGGEPFMNPDIFAMLEDALTRGFRALVLTNAMRPMQRAKAQLLALKERFGRRLTLRVSLDHHTPGRHEDERGPGTFQPTLDGLIWLARNGFAIAVAGRTMWGEPEGTERAGYARLFAEHGIALDAFDPAKLVLFPEMDASRDVPEITTACWGILHKSPADVMCATSRMVVRRKGSARASVVACTLTPYDPQFELGPTLKDAARPVALNHPHCARFCVLGGASCSAG